MILTDTSQRALPVLPVTLLHKVKRHLSLDCWWFLWRLWCWRAIFNLLARRACFSYWNQCIAKEKTYEHGVINITYMQLTDTKEQLSVSNKQTTFRFKTSFNRKHVIVLAKNYMYPQNRNYKLLHCGLKAERHIIHSFASWRFINVNQLMVRVVTIQFRSLNWTILNWLTEYSVICMRQVALTVRETLKFMLILKSRFVFVLLCFSCLDWYRLQK